MDCTIIAKVCNNYFILAHNYFHLFHTDNENNRKKRQTGAIPFEDLGDVPDAVDAENEFLITYMAVSNEKSNLQMHFAFLHVKQFSFWRMRDKHLGTSLTT